MSQTRHLEPGTRACEKRHRYRVEQDTLAFQQGSWHVSFAAHPRKSEQTAVANGASFPPTLLVFPTDRANLVGQYAGRALGLSPSCARSSPVRSSCEDQPG